MERKICPYLGLADDKDTSLAFLSEGNYCHKALPPAPVNSEHQSGFCMTGQHTACPVYLAQKAAPLPAALVSPQHRLEQIRSRLRSAIPLAVILMIFLTGSWVNGQRFAAQTISRADTLPVTGMRLLTPPTGADAQPNGAIPTNALFAGAGSDCLSPEGWELYTVQPTDSIYRVSIFYQVSVETLQQANCMGSETYLAPGSTLYVPAALPTAVPTATAVPVPVVPLVVSQPDDDDDNDKKDNRPAVVPTPTPEDKDDGGKDDGGGTDDGGTDGGGTDDGGTDDGGTDDGGTDDGGTDDGGTDDDQGAGKDNDDKDKGDKGGGKDNGGKDKDGKGGGKDNGGKDKDGKGGGKDNGGKDKDDKGGGKGKK